MYQKNIFQSRITFLDVQDILIRQMQEIELDKLKHNPDQIEIEFKIDQ